MAIVSVGPPLLLSEARFGLTVMGVVPVSVPVSVTTMLLSTSVTVAVLVLLPLRSLLTRSTPPVVAVRMLSVIVAVAVTAPPVVTLLP